MKLKLKKRSYVILVVLLLLVVAIIHKRNYIINYKVASASIKEEYNKKLNIHYLEVTKAKKVYFFVVENNRKKRIVNKIDYYSKDKITCLKIKGKN